MFKFGPTYLFLVIMAALNIVTINAQGLQDKQKRMNFFQTLRNENFDVIAIQETHCDYNSLSAWKHEWGGNSVWTHYASDKAGVAILFNSKRNVNILAHSACNEGRILTVTAEIDSNIFQFVNIYGPNPTSLLESNVFFSQI